MESEWKALGTHGIRAAGDVVEIRQCGVMSLDDVTGYFRCVDVLVKQYGYSLSLFDHRQGDTMEASARNYIGQRSKVFRAPTALAIFGSSWRYRTLSRLIVRAINMIRQPPLLCGFFSIEVEARAYLDLNRNSFRAQLAPTFTKGPF